MLIMPCWKLLALPIPPWLLLDSDEVAGIDTLATEAKVVPFYL
jgi:hypothetical protein